MDRELPFFRDDKSYADDYPLVLVGAMHYPSCPASAEHFRRIAGDDEDRTPGWRSQIGQLVHGDVARRKKQGHIVGHIFSSIAEAHASRESLSLNKAYFLALRYATSATVEGQAFRPATTRGIRDAFDNFRDVGHFWAAQVIFPDLFIQVATSHDAFLKFLAVASDIAADVAEAGSVTNWSPWTVPPALLPKGRALKVPPISDEKKAWLAEYNSEIGR